MTLGYNFNGPLLKRMHLTSTRFYLTGVNLLTFTKYTGWDPEVNTDASSTHKNQGVDFYAAPQIRNISIGLNVGF
jgi:hypothetical protein